MFDITASIHPNRWIQECRVIKTVFIKVFKCCTQLLILLETEFTNAEYKWDRRNLMDVLECATALYGYKMGKSLKYKYMISLSHCFFKKFIVFKI